MCQRRECCFYQWDITRHLGFRIGFYPGIAASDWSQVLFVGATTIVFDNPMEAGYAFMSISNHSKIDMSGQTITFSSTPDLAVFVAADEYSNLRAVGTTFSGAVDAATKKFALTNESLIETDIALGSWPGSVAGTHDNWSHYNDVFPAGGGGSMTMDTAKNILASTPTSGSMAFATDINQFFIADGTHWIISSSFFTTEPELPDIGASAYSRSRKGYGDGYITDLSINNCFIGQNQPPSPHEGTICFTPSLGQYGQLQQYSVGAWHPVVVGLVLTEAVDLSQAITQTPIGKTLPIIVFNGDSVLKGLNNTPVIEGYIASMGTYPPQQIISGTF